MNLLIDTHALLWFYSGDNNLSSVAKEVIKDTTNTCFVSVASLWEVTIKHHLGKLDLIDSLEIFFDFISRNEIKVLQIEFLHLLKLSGLPHIHKDPFDRIIIAQSIAENLVVVTKDRFFDEYQVSILW